VVTATITKIYPESPKATTYCLAWKAEISATNNRHRT